MMIKPGTAKIKQVFIMAVGLKTATSVYVLILQM